MKIIIKLFLWVGNMMSDTYTIIFYIASATILPLLMGTQSSKLPKTIKKILLWIPAIILFLVMAFRYNVGSDYYNYIRIYNEISRNGLLWSLGTLRTEPLYATFNYLVYLVFDNHDFVFILSSAFVILVFFRSIKYYLEPRYYPIALLIFITSFYFGFFTYIRLSIALMIIFYGYRFLVESKYFKWLLIVILASGFHYTALIMAPIIFFVKTSYTSYFKTVVFMFLTVLLFIAFSFIGETFMQGTKYYSYFTGERFGNFQGGLNQIIIHVPLLLLVLFKKNNYSKDSDFYLPIYKLFIYGSILMLFTLYLGIINRMLNYLLISQLIIIPIAVKNCEKHEKYLLTLFVILYYIGLFVYSLITGSRLIPYEWIL